MKNKLLYVATSSVIAGALLMSGTALAHDNKETKGNVLASVQSGLNSNAKISHDNDGDDDHGEVRDHASSSKEKREKHATSTKPSIIFKGNGQPVVGGTVAAVSGNTITLSTSAGVVYTVTAGSSTVIKGNATSSVSGITVGDKVVVQGAINGTSIAATSVLDSSATKHGSGIKVGIFGRVGGFFHNFFGFF